MKRKLYRIKTSGIGYNITSQLQILNFKKNIEIKKNVEYNSTIKIEIKEKINNKQYLVIDFSKYKYLNKRVLYKFFSLNKRKGQ